MSDINFYVTAQNIDIQKLWASLGYGENKTLN